MVVMVVMVEVRVTTSGSWEEVTKAELTEVGTFMPPEVEKSVVAGPGVLWARPVELMATVKRPDRV
jgi:hypothetical protein